MDAALIVSLIAAALAAPATILGALATVKQRGNDQIKLNYEQMNRTIERLQLRVDECERDRRRLWDSIEKRPLG